MRLFVVLVMLMAVYTPDANAAWQLLDTVLTTYGGGRPTKIYFDSGRIARSKKNVKVYIGMNKYPTGNEVKELSRATINCKSPGSDVEFFGSEYGNKSASNLLHEHGVFNKLITEICP